MPGNRAASTATSTKTSTSRPTALLLALAAFMMAVLALCSLPGKAFASDIKQVDFGFSYSAILRTDGSLWMSGYNEYGQLGDNTRNNRSTFTKVMDGVASVSLGDYHSAAIKTDGSLWMWGRNDKGQLADASYANRAKPAKVMDGVASVSLGYSCSAVVKTDGSLWMWGNLSSEAYPETHTTPLKLMDDVASVEVGGKIYIETETERHKAIALKKDGSVWNLAWKKNSDGKYAFSPSKKIDGVAAISAGSLHYAALKKDGSLWMWGYDLNGQLGLGGYTDLARWDNPMKIMDNVASVDLGGHHSAALKKDGSLWIWGWNEYGQLGDGTNIDLYRPVKLMDGVESIAMGLGTSSAIKTDGSLWLWGDNELGNFGDGTCKDKSTPWKAEFNLLDPVIKFAMPSVTKRTADAPFVNPLTLTTDGTDTAFTSSNTSVATVDSTGKVTLKGKGSCMITVTTSAGTFYKAGSASYALAVKKAEDPAKSIKWKGKNKVEVIGGNSKTKFPLNPGAKKGKFKYKSSTPKVKVDKKGNVTIAKGFLGTAVITIVSKETSMGKATKKKIKIVVKLPKPRIKKFTSPSRNKVVIAWSKPPYWDGIEFSISKTKKFSKAQKVPVKSPKTSVSIGGSKLRSGNAYYTKIRTYKAYNGKTHYSAWSLAKMTKVK